MIGIIIYLFLLGVCILIAWRVYKSPIGIDPAFSLMWRGAVGGFVGGFSGLLTLGGARSPYFPMILIFSTLFTPVFGMMFTGIVWWIQVKAGIFAGLTQRAVIGAIVGIVIGSIAGAVYPFIQYDEIQKRFYPSPNLNAVMHSVIIFIILGTAIGIAAGIMAGPRNQGKSETNSGAASSTSGPES